MTLYHILFNSYVISSLWRITIAISHWTMYLRKLFVQVFRPVHTWPAAQFCRISTIHQGMALHFSPCWVQGGFHTNLTCNFGPSSAWFHYDLLTDFFRSLRWILSPDIQPNNAAKILFYMTCGIWLNWSLWISTFCKMCWYPITETNFL